MKPSMRPPAALIPGWTVAEAAQYLATTAEQIYQLVSARRIPYRKIGTKLLFRRETLDAWLAELPGVSVETAVQHCRSVDRDAGADAGGAHSNQPDMTQSDSTDGCPVSPVFTSI